ncbi:MAG: hypothetical protein FK730_03340 [Asgard group archaeon]|nr:hypothetical protein [Asgard group archaeon]
MVLELQRTGTIVLAVLIPIIAILASLLIYYLSKRNDKPKISRVASLIITPIQFKPLMNNPELNDKTEMESKKYVRKEIFSRAFLIYYIIGIFIFCSFMGELYQILTDRALVIIFTRVIDGASPPESVWTSTVIDSPFSSGFRGYSTWYGMYPNPILPVNYFQRTWEWIFYSSGLYNNLFPNMQYEFFGESVNTLVYGFSSLIIVATLLIGGLFLMQLLWKGIRKSFLASLFFFEAGMIIGTKGIFSCFATAWQIEVNGKLLQYGAYIISRTTIAAQWVILGILPAIIGLYFLFLWIGKKIWQIHYSESQSLSKKSFLISVSINYFAALLILLFL